MRVTNGMLVNTTLNGLYNNMNAMNKTYAQMTTGKKIQTVSDDPIIAGRALKLKTSVLENEQYASNTKEATSWMEITEGALDNIHKILQTIRTKCVEAATGTLENKDKEIIKNEIEELWKQIQEEGNVSYGGRYVFSGYKTSEPLVLTTDTKLKEDCKLEVDLYIAGEMKIAGITETTNESKSIAKAESILGSGTILGKDIVLAEGTQLPRGTVLSKEDAKDILDMTPNENEYTLVFNYTVSKDTKLSQKAAEELAELIGEKIEDFAKNENGTYQVKEDIVISAGKTLSKEVSEEVLGVTVSGESYEIPQNYTLNKECKISQGITLGSNMKVLKDITLTKGTILKQGSNLLKDTTLPAGTLNPIVSGKIAGQSIEYEIGVNSTISVNTKKMDEIFSGIAQAIGKLSSEIEISLKDDSATTEDLYKFFNEQLGEFDELLGEVSKATTDLGARMARVDYVESRLTDQKTTLKSLLSDTEDIDIEEVYVKFNTQYATYQSALQATSKIITNTLADYL